VIISSMAIRFGEPAAHVFTTGCCATISAPRNLIEPTSSNGVGWMRAGRKPCPVYSNTTSDPSPCGIGRKNPVTALDTASIFCVAISKRKMLETPV
jgi:hypothetical protein